MWTYFFSAVAAFIFLSYTYYFATFATGGLPIRASGYGLFSSLLCLGTFAAFFFINIRLDQIAAPRILSVTASTYKATAGDTVNFVGDSYDESGDIVGWKWCVRGPSETSECYKPGLRNFVWQISDDATSGTYKVFAFASDGRSTTRAEALEIEVCPEI